MNNDSTQYEAAGNGRAPDTPAGHKMPEAATEGDTLAGMFDAGSGGTDRMLSLLAQVSASTSQAVAETSVQVSALTASMAVMERYLMARDGTAPPDNADAAAGTEGPATTPGTNTADGTGTQPDPAHAGAKEGGDA